MKHIGRIKVLLYDCENEFESVCECPHCSSEVLYGNMMTVSGIHCCPKCNAEVNRQIEFDKKADYDVYVRKANNHEYEPYRYMEGK